MKKVDSDTTSAYFKFMQPQTLKNRLRRYPEISAAYLFGSTATQRSGPLSDVDLALLLVPDTSQSRTLSLICDVASDVQECFQKEADVKILNRLRLSDLPFLYEILSTGKLIYERDSQHHRSFVAGAIMAYLDFQPVYERMLRNYRRHLRHGQT